MKTEIISRYIIGIGLTTVELLTYNPNIKIISNSTSGIHPLLSSNFECHQLNLSYSKSIFNFVDKICTTKIDFLINNTGILIEK